MSRRKQIYIVVSVVVLVLGGFVAFYVLAQHKKTSDPYYPKSSEKPPTSSSSPSSTPKPTSTGGTALNPGHTDIPKTNAPQASSSGSIIIASPTQGATVTSGTQVSGQAKVSQATLYFRLKGGKSGQLASGVVKITPSNSDYMSYSFQLAFTNQVSDSPDQGVLEVYTLSPADGSETNVANVTVNIQG